MVSILTLLFEITIGFCRSVCVCVCMRACQNLSECELCLYMMTWHTV